jgi:hypothetical protein
LGGVVAPESLWGVALIVQLYPTASTMIAVKAMETWPTIAVLPVSRSNRT